MRFSDERGATMLEYGIMAAFIAAVAFLAVKTLGGTVQGLFQTVIDTL